MARLVLLIFFVIAGFRLARAEDAPAAPAAPAAEPSESAPAAATPVPVEAPAPRKVRKAPVIKDADGSEAPNRFEAETVIKSRYMLEGRKLEVDPD